MASFPALCQAVGPAEENGELDGSLQQMLKAIADERTRLNLRQEISGLGERRIQGGSEVPAAGGGAPEPGGHPTVHAAAIWPQNNHAEILIIKVTGKSENCHFCKVQD